MDDNFYKQLIEESQIGYAYHKIICDEDGIPCDYEFIEVNGAFEKLTGLKGSKIVGRKVTEVLPNITNNKFDWIHCYGDIAINGGNREVEQFSESLERWYSVNIYSPEKYYFITSIIDITKKMSGMKRIVEISKEFLQMNEQKIEYQKITDDFLKLSGAKYAAFNLFDEEGKNFTTIAISGDKELLRYASDILGFKPENKKWSYKLVRDEQRNSETITHCHSLKDLVGKVVTIPLVTLIEKALNIGEVIIIKILIEDNILGDFILFMKKGETFDKDVFAELYASQLGLVITRKRAENKLSQEKILTDAIFQSAPGMLYLYDDQRRLVRWNKKYEELTGYSSEELFNSDLSYWNRTGNENSHKAILNGIERAIEDGFGDGEVELPKKDGTILPMYFTASSLYLDGKQYIAGIAIDITERKRRIKEISYLSYHDQLTGLYNRRFYEDELGRLDREGDLPLTIVIGDINGLKLINDSFGYAMGDKLLKKVAEILIKGCRADDIIARLGGDEFVIILPKADAMVAEQIVKRIINLSLCEKVGSIDISISFGYGTKIYKEEEMEKVFKSAEDHMYERKLFESPSMRGKTIRAIINTLYEKNLREEQHSHRVSQLCKSMGEALEMPDYEIEELKSVGLLHDIGKIAIDEYILNKPDKLTSDEWKEIKRHSEIGYRILSTVNDMSQMANYVLAHHERWDGKGYPKGLKWEEIPFKSRIIAIADSYDAMTSERSYRNGLPQEVAISELKINAGTQFDPELVNVFIEKVLKDL